MADGQALLAVLDAETDITKLRTAFKGISGLLEPLLALGGSGQATVEALRPVARAHGSLVTSLVKSMGTRLSPELHYDSEQLVVLGEAACLGLNALDCLRPVIKASRHELDVQRYNFIRKLAALGLHTLAMTQGKVLHSSIATSLGSMAVPSDLHIATVANLLVCYSELVKSDASHAGALWTDISGHVDSLLRLARDATDTKEAGKRLEPVLKCLSKVVETLFYANVVCELSPVAVSEQLSALVACGAVCRQERAVQQMLVDDAAGATEAVQVGLVDAMLHHLSAQGTLPDSMRPLLHHVAISLVQKRKGPPRPLDDTSPNEHPLAVLVRVALQLPCCTLASPHAPELQDLLRTLSIAAKVVAETTAAPDGWLRWCCLDVLRVSVASVMTQLVSTPQSGGGQLPVLAHCMELLCATSSNLSSSDEAVIADTVLPSGCSAVTIAVRLQAAHSLCTGQLAGLHEDMARSMDLLRRLIQRSNDYTNRDGVAGIGPAILQGLSASLGNAGLDLLQAQHALPAVELLQFAAELALRRARQLLDRGDATPDMDVLHVIKKCKAHVMALQQLSDHIGAMAAAAAYVAALHSFVGCNIHLLWSFTKSFVRSNVTAAELAAATAVPTQPRKPTSAPNEPPSAAPAAPSKANRRGGRLQRMQANERTEAAGDVDCGSQRLGSQPGGPTGEAERGLQSIAASPSVAVTASSSLVQMLVAAVQENGAPPGLLNALDMYAVQELEAVAEESKRRGEVDEFQKSYSTAVIGVLLRSAESSQPLGARALLVRALMADTQLACQTDDLRASCELLDNKLASMQELEGLPDGAGAEPGLLDSAALAHAHLGLCLAQSQLAQRPCMAGDEPINHIVRAINLWDQLRRMHAGDSTTLVLRMPRATLHAALEVQQLLQLRAITHVEVSTDCGQVIWRLMGALSSQVKLREQHVYMLCATMPATTCTAWALAPQPWLPLAEAISDARQHPKLTEVLKLTQPIREAYATDAADHIKLASTADSCASELERSGFLRHGAGPLMLRVQCHQLAAAAYLRAGDTTNAYVQAQEALRITCALFATLDCPVLTCQGSAAGISAASQPAAAPGRDMTPAETAAAAVKSGAVMNALDYAVEGLDEQEESLANGPHPQVAALDTSAACAAKGVAAPGLKLRHGTSVGLAWAVAAAHLASLHQAARVFEAAGCAEDATCLWKECSRTAELFSAEGMQALCCNHLAELSCRRGDADAAKSQLQAAAGIVEQLGHRRGACRDAFEIESALLRAHYAAARARIAILCQQHNQIEEACRCGAAACDAVLLSAVPCHSQQKVKGSSKSHVGSDASERPNTPAWYAVCLRSQLERLRAEALLRLGRRQEAAGVLEDAQQLLQQQARMCSGRNAADVWPIDHGLLLVHQAFAAASVTELACRSSGIRVVGLSAGEATQDSVNAGSANAQPGDTADVSDGMSHADQSRKKGTKAQPINKQPKASTKQPREEQPAEAAPCAQTMPRSLSALLVSLRLCWQLPLAAAYACRQLLHASIVLGLPHAASMFLHLGHGMSYAQQQALQRHLRRGPTQRGSQSPGLAGVARDVCGAAEGTDSAEVDGKPLDQGTILTADMRDVALQMVSRLSTLGDDGNYFTALEQGAEVWLCQALRLLPAGAVVTSIIQDSDGQVLLGRITDGSVPLLLALSEAGSAGHDGQGGADPSSGGVTGRVLDRCVARLGGLLDESGDSMRLDQDTASSHSHKAKWWKTRTSLDQRVKGLLQDLDEQCFGPWRCLLLPVPIYHRDVLRTAADEFIAEHFPAVAVEPTCRDRRRMERLRLLQELLVLTLSHMRHLQRPELITLLQVLCSEACQPADPARVSALATELAAVEAAAGVQLLRLPSAEQSASTESGEVSGSNRASPAPETDVVDRRSAAAASKAAGPSAATCGRAGVVQGVRARPGAARAQPQTAVVARPGVKELGRRAGSVASSGTRAPTDLENSSALKTGPTVEAASGARRGTRLAAMQPEPSSNQAATSKSTARGAATRVAARGRTTPAVTDGAQLQDVRAAQESHGVKGPPAAPPPALDATTGINDRDAGVQRVGPVLLMLSPALHAIPWESIPCCIGREIYRIISLPVACAAASRAVAVFADPSAKRAAAATLSDSDGVAAASGEDASVASAPSVPTAYYVLNPSGDLVDTERYFQPLLEEQPTWEGLTGVWPSARVLLAALQSHDLFLYFGHGSGEQFLPLAALRKLQCCATSLLMGCSSGRLRLHGAYDPSGAAVAYLLAGCPALVANLWDVTDRDIDRFSQALMRSWLRCPGSSQPADTLGSSTGAGSPQAERGCKPLGVATTESRAACKLPHLVGAAPVCYGLPLTSSSILGRNPS